MMMHWSDRWGHVCMDVYQRGGRGQGLCVLAILRTAASVVSVNPHRMGLRTRRGACGSRKSRTTRVEPRGLDSTDKNSKLTDDDVQPTSGCTFASFFLLCFHDQRPINDSMAISRVQVRDQERQHAGFSNQSMPVGQSVGNNHDQGHSKPLVPLALPHRSGAGELERHEQLRNQDRQSDARPDLFVRGRLAPARVEPRARSEACGGGTGLGLGLTWNDRMHRMKGISCIIQTLTHLSRPGRPCRGSYGSCCSN